MGIDLTPGVVFLINTSVV
ncbi:MAG: hypothetical protein ACLR28_12955 [Flavonifractor plautii]|nr:hypothetical protein [Flavonifractor plautii]